MRQNIDERGKKLFIGGLHLKTNEESLRNFYSQWGEIVDCVVMKDNQTGRSRGFGFVTYKDAESVDLAQGNRPHEIDGIKVDSKRAMPKEDTSPEFHATVNRLFVGRLKKSHTAESLKNYFGHFGAISDAVLIKNPNGESRGFGFITFEDTDCVDKIIVFRPHQIDGQTIEVKKAQPRDDKKPSSNVNKSSSAGNKPSANRGGYSYSDSFNNPYPENYNAYNDYPSSNNANRSFGGSSDVNPSYSHNYSSGSNGAGNRFSNDSYSDQYLNGNSYNQPSYQQSQQQSYGYPSSYGQYNTPNPAPTRYTYQSSGSGMGEYNQKMGGTGGPMRNAPRYGRGGHTNPY